MTQVATGGAPVLLTSSGIVSNIPGTLIGFYVNSTSSGTVIVKDGVVTGATAITGTITPAIGWQQCNMQCSTGCYITIGSTINATFIFQPG